MMVIVMAIQRTEIGINMNGSDIIMIEKIRMKKKLPMKHILLLLFNWWLRVQHNNEMKSYKGEVERGGGRGRREAVCVMNHWWLDT